MSAAANPPKKSSTAVQNWMTLLLSIAGGGVDAAMILRFNVLTAAQTGNTILLAVALAERRLTTGLDSAVSVIAYILGSIVGELVILAPTRSSRLSPVARGLLVELVPLAALLACWDRGGSRPHPALVAVLVALSAVAMGIQSAVVLRIPAGPTTTYVTGTLTHFATRTVERLRRKTEPERPPRGGVLSSDRPAIYGLDWLVYASGALASAILFLSVHEAAFVLPVAAVVAAAAIAIWKGAGDSNNR